MTIQKEERPLPPEVKPPSCVTYKAKMPRFRGLGKPPSHFLCAGPTKSGKTCLAVNLLFALKDLPVRVWVFSPTCKTDDENYGPIQKFTYAPKSQGGLGVDPSEETTFETWDDA